MIGKKTIVLFSGGQDSTTCLFWALQNFQEVEAIAFDYGQKHKVELKQAQIIADITNVPLSILPLQGLLSNSALTNSEIDVDDKHHLNPDVPATFVPGRNLLFLSIAGSFAFNQGSEHLVTGTCETDFSGYPDCRRSFIDSLEQTLTLALDKEMNIHTPLMYLDKADTFKLAEELGCLDIVLEHSHTDYNGNRTEKHAWGYGKLDNEASRLRAKGWHEYIQRYKS